MKNAPVDVSVVIVTYNTCDLTLACLKSVFIETKRGVEVVLVDNNSVDGTREEVSRRYPDVKIIANQDNKGFPKAVNQGIRQSSGRFVLLLNSDAEVTDGAIDKMIAFADAHPSIGVLGPKLMFPDGRIQEMSERFPRLRYILADIVFLSKVFSRWQWVNRRYNDLGKNPDGTVVDKVMGSAFLIRREVIDKVGLLDERFFMYYEETDFCLRAKKAGWQVVYWPGATMVHIWNGSTKTFNAAAVGRSLKSMHQYFAKHFGTVYASLADMAMCLSGLSHYIVLKCCALVGVSVGGAEALDWNREIVRYYLPFRNK